MVAVYPRVFIPIATVIMACGAERAAAQVPVREAAANRAVLAGRIVDRNTGHPVAGARVYISGVADTLNAGTDGRFRTDRADMGAHVIEVAAIGYLASRWVLELGDAGNEVLFEIEPRLPLLDTLPVAGRREIISPNDWRSPEQFELRRHRGGGSFLTQEQIEQSHARTLAELLPMIPGVMIQCSGANGRTCSVLMAAALHRCPVDYYLDGAPASNATGPSFPAVGIRGIEVYRAADVPIEFAKPNSTCGVIAIWTRMER